MTDDSSARTVRLVLDNSSIAAFTRGSIAVGELIGEIDSEHGAVIVPLPCLIEVAAERVDGRELLDILIGHPATFLVSDDPSQWRELAGVRAILGRADLASAAWIALDYEVLILTRHPEAYEKLGGGDMALPFEED